MYIRNQNNYAEFDTVVSIDFDILTDKPIKIDISGISNKRLYTFGTYQYHGTVLAIKFVMPDQDVIIKITEEERTMDPNSNQVLVDRFEVPDELARELSDLLTRQTIRERMLMQLLDDTDKYKKVEDTLVPITARIEAIKLKITKEYIPPEYNSVRYIWNYDGYEVDGNRLQIIDTDPPRATM